MLRRSIRWACAAQSVARGVDRPKLFLTPGQKVEGFTYLQAREVPELHVVGYEFVHDKTGARYFHFDTDDQNNAFNITFCTPATSDKGTTHVLEHTVLCGSEKYPVRDPFFHMLRRSLNTFMNAMTGPDYTMYPFSTTNAKDYQNLLDVYLDAVLHPLLRKEDFRQEGHRIEFKAPEAAAEGAPAENTTSAESQPPTSAPSAEKASVNGVVFNEMRGVVSQPGSHFLHEVWRHALPGTHYEYQSGGLPAHILKLTHEELIQYHRTYYHPSNSIIMTYGDLAPWSHMKKLNTAFEAFDKTTAMVPPKLEESKRFPAPKKVALKGPPDLMGDLQKQKRVAVSYVLPDGVDNSPESLIRFSMLNEMMCSGPNSPMYKALIAPQVGSRYAAANGYSYYLTSPMFSFGIDGVDEKGKYTTEEIEKIIGDTIEKAKKEGFDQKRLDSVVFQEELQMRHRSTSFGINLVTNLSAISSTRRALHPLSMLNNIPELKRIQAQPTILTDLLQEAIVTNAHKVTVAVTSDAEYLNGIQKEIDEHEAKINAALTEKDIQELKKENAEWLERVKAPQDPGVLPTLKVSDIPEKGFKEPDPVQVSDRIWLIPYSTNGLVYLSGQMPVYDSLLREGKEGELAQLRAPLYHRLLTKLGAGNIDFEQFDIEANLVSGGFGVGCGIHSARPSAKDFVSYMSFGFYTTQEKLEDALKLLRLLLLSPVTELRNEKEVQRFTSLITGRAANSISNLQHQGHVVAMTRACTGLAPSATLSERFGGLTQTEFLKSLQEKLQKGQESATECRTELLAGYTSFVDDFRATLGLTNIFATCESGSMNKVQNSLEKFRDDLRSFAGTKRYPSEQRYDDAEMLRPLNATATFNPVRAVTDPERVPLPMDTNFVGMAIGTGLAFADRDHQAIRLACQILQSNFLHRKVREEGGAYGAMAGASLQGDAGGITLGSYRDPTPEKTVEVFQQCAQWLLEPESVTEQAVSEGKLRLFSKLDAPMSADQFGQARFHHHGYWAAQQVSRQQLLGMTPDDIRGVAKYFKPERAQIAILKGERTAAAGEAAEGQDAGPSC